MNKLVKIALALTAIIIVIGVGGPLITGIIIQKNYHTNLDFYNSLSGVHVVSTHYKRGWLSSDVTLSVEINNNNYISVLNSLGIKNEKIPRRYTIDQHIQHGPILYNRFVNMPWRIGLATITNKLRNTPTLQQLYDYLGVDDQLILASDQYISLRGNHFYHFKFSAIHFLYPEMEQFLKIDGLESDVWLNPRNLRTKGHIRLQSVVAKSQGDSISFPDLSYEFDVYPDQNKIWLGDSILRLSQFIASEQSSLTAILSDVYYHSHTDIVAGKFNSHRQIDITQLQFNDEIIGPFHFDGGIEQINAQALADLIATYHAILQRGELYPGQLEKKMIFLVPTLIHSGSTIQLNRFEINTPHGKLSINGQLRWDMSNSSIPNELPELLRAANGTLQLRLSKSLVNDLIEFYIMSPLMHDEIFSIDEEKANTLSDNIYYNMQNNSLLIESLVNEGQLRDIDAIDLLKLQKEMAPIQDYANQIRQILWDKYLTRQTSYLLFWGYVGVEHSIVTLEKAIQESQDAAKSDLYKELQHMIKKGYIVENGNEYTVSVKQKEGKIKINEHNLSP